MEEHFKCSLNLGSDKKELETRGTPMFPCQGYQGDVRHYLTGEIPWHWHEELEIIYLTEGKMMVGADAGRFLISRGEAALINSNVLHTGSAKAAGACTYYSFVFHESLISGRAESVLAQKYVRPFLACRKIPAVHFQSQIPWQKEAAECVRDAYQAYSARDWGYEFAVRDRLSRLWYLMVTHLEPVWRENTAGEDQGAVRIKAMMQYIQEHFQENVDLKSLADAASISERECLRCFQKSLGMSPIQYLMKYRVATAASLLKETSLPVASISSRSGFDSSSYFTVIFKRFMGCTPREYRKKD